MRIILLSVTVLISSLILFSCKKDNPIPPEDQPQVSLTLEDVSCTEAWIKLSTSNLPLPADVDLYKDSSLAETINLTTSDTVLYVDSLLPNQSYSFHSIIHPFNHSIASDPLQVTTMDTTSHNFTWQTFTFGNPNFGSSELKDVAIIDENNIWAVGEIYNDTTGLLYNAVHWDGSQWKLKRITINFRGNDVTPSLEGIFAFSSSQIWLVGGLAIFGDGYNWTSYDVRQITGYDSLSFTKCWGSNYENMYYSGRKGSLAHFSNGTWNRIASGTTTNLNDIWGYNDLSGNRQSILTVASNILQQGEFRLLAVSDNQAEDTLNWPYQHWLKGVWFQDQYSPIYVCGSGIREYRKGNWELLNLPTIFSESIRGSNVNNIFCVGDYGYVTHFNGINWKVYNNFTGDNLFTSVAVKNNMIVIGGINASGGIAGGVIIVMGENKQ